MCYHLSMVGDIMLDKLSYICTAGPSMANESILEEMYKLGMNTIRFNMSYNHPKLYDLINLAKELKIKHPDVSLLIDSAGPEIRVLIDNPLEFSFGDIITIGKEFKLTSSDLTLLQNGDLVYLKDGDYVLEVIENAGDVVKCKALTSGIIKNNLKVYNEKLYDSLPFLSEYDEECIKLACENNADYFAVSFVRNAENILLVKEMLKKYGKEDIKVIAKIETPKSLANLEEIINVSDEVMIARGDLSTLTPRANIGYYQKFICKKCQEKNKPVMLATGVLASMEQKEEPSIAEILDLYNIVLDGINKIVFTSETSVSIDPLDVLSTANKIFDTVKKKN